MKPSASPFNGNHFICNTISTSSLYHFKGNATLYLKPHSLSPLDYSTLIDLNFVCFHFGRVSHNCPFMWNLFLSCCRCLNVFCLVPSSIFHVYKRRPFMSGFSIKMCRNLFVWAWMNPVFIVHVIITKTGSTQNIWLCMT